MENVKDHTIEKIKSKLIEMNTDLNKISYLENVIKEKNFTLEVKRFILGYLSKLYENRKMYRKAAKAIINKATIEISMKDKIESFLSAAELYAKLGDVDEAEHMFNMASRNVDDIQKARIDLAKKNIYSVFAEELDRQGKKSSAIKFYEKLIRMSLDPLERSDIKGKLKSRYQSLGLFREINYLEGLK